MRRVILCSSFFFQAEDGIRDLVRSRGLGDVYKRQEYANEAMINWSRNSVFFIGSERSKGRF